MFMELIDEYCIEDRAIDAIKAKYFFLIDSGKESVICNCIQKNIMGFMIQILKKTKYRRSR